MRVVARVLVPTSLNDRLFLYLFCVCLAFGVHDVQILLKHGHDQQKAVAMLYANDVIEESEYLLLVE